MVLLEEEGRTTTAELCDYWYSGIITVLKNGMAIIRELLFYETCDLTVKEEEKHYSVFYCY